MLRASPGSDFEAYTSAFATGLTGTIGVRLRDGQGADAVARATAGIHEDIAGSGIYRVTLTAPSVAGQYWLIWDNGSGLFSEPEQLLVTSTVLAPAVPSGRDLCSLEDVIAIVPGYTLGDEPDTEDTLTLLITQESRDFMEFTGREVTAKDTDPDRLFDLDRFTIEERELDIGDAGSVSAVQIEDLDGNVLHATPAFVELPRSREDWEPVTYLSFPRAITDAALLGHGQIARVTATWGFPEIPDTVRRAVARMVIARYLNDVAAEGTTFAEAANRNEFNIGAALRIALDTRDRFRNIPVG